MAGERYVIVVGIDFSDSSWRAFDHALEAASARENAEVHVVYVEPEVFIGPVLSKPMVNAVDASETLAEMQKLVSERFEKTTVKYDRRHIKRAMVHHRRGQAAEGIAQLAADLDADLVVVGSHGRTGIERVFLGSVTEKVSRLARCPVWIVRNKNHSTEGKVPEIEPPCPDCLKTRAETNGAQMWCARHSEHHPHAHTYSYASNGVYAAETAAYESFPER